MVFKVYFREGDILHGTDTYPTIEDADRAGRYWVSGRPRNRSYTIEPCKG